MPGIKRRIRLPSACYKWFKRELYDIATAPLTRRVRMLTAEVIETQLYGCATWTFGQEHFAGLQTAHHKLLLRVTGIQRR